MDSQSSIRNPMNLRMSMSGALLAVIAIAFLPFVAGCGDEDPVVVKDNDDFVENTPPFPPDGVFSVTGDRMVTIYWNANWEADLAGYAVFRDDDNDGWYDHIADVDWYEFCDHPYDHLVNTVDESILCYEDTNLEYDRTYFYAILAFDEANNESELSYEVVYDTPRPEGFDLVLFDFMGQSSGLSGYDFSDTTGTAEPQADGSTDIYFGVVDNGERLINTIFTNAGAAIQDYGLIELDDVHRAPVSGWAPSGRVEAIKDHSYVIRIAGAGGNNYAKIQVTDVSNDSVTLNWAYQPSLDNIELIPPGPGGGSR
jgi:hypothetical protein